MFLILYITLIKFIVSYTLHCTYQIYCLLYFTLHLSNLLFFILYIALIKFIVFYTLHCTRCIEHYSLKIVVDVELVTKLRILDFARVIKTHILYEYSINYSVPVKMIMLKSHLMGFLIYWSQNSLLMSPLLLPLTWLLTPLFNKLS